MASFDERARDWDSDPVKVERAHLAADAIRKAIPPAASMSALEYGCGTGLLSFELRNSLGHITLADTSTGMLEVLEEKIAASGASNLHAVNLDLTQGTIPPERFDLVYSLLVLHHIPDTRRILSAFYEILQPGGTLCICDLDHEDGTFHDAEFTGHLGFERASLAELVQAAGFASVVISTAFTTQKHNHAYPLFLLVAQKPARA